MVPSERPKLLTVSPAFFAQAKIPAPNGGHRESGDSCEKPRRLSGVVEMATLTVNFEGEISITKKLTGLDGETDRNLGATVEHFKDVVANQASEFAPEFLL